jgi:glutamyl-Q tRNA(Asp) synthetase
MRYVGRFAPTPSGALHAGSLVAALASWLDARAHSGQWLVRIEDLDGPRCVRGADQLILQQLAAFGLLPDAPPLYQSQRGTLYQAALERLLAADLAYPCGCSRRDIALAHVALGQPRSRHQELVYPGTCREGLHGQRARAWRLRCSGTQGDTVITWHDRRLGAQTQNLTQQVGDFVLLRADGLWSYQLGVVVDDAAQGVSAVVRGQDLADNTARQIWLQRCLALATPQYLHVPLVLGADGEKLSKQNGAQALSLAQPLTTLAAAAQVLDLQAPCERGATLHDALAAWVRQWALRYPMAGVNAVQ